MLYSLHKGFAEVATYTGRVRLFGAADWAVYCVWVGLMAGLTGALASFIGWGHWHHVSFPADVYYVPLGALAFTVAIGVDTIGHRTVYRDDLAGGEALVHHITIVMGITSCLALCLGYTYPDAAFVPAAITTALSVMYSIIDEAMHWKRYLDRRSDHVEMWSHVLIFLGHGTMMLGWWRWYLDGYQGVAATLAAFACS